MGAYEWVRNVSFSGKLARELNGRSYGISQLPKLGVHNFCNGRLINFNCTAAQNSLIKLFSDIYELHVP